jgi:hypothetical protein
MPASAVLLLAKPHLFGEDELRAAAERAWRRSFAGGEGSRHFVVQKSTTFVKVGPHVLQLIHSAQPYLAELSEAELKDFLPEADRRQAWKRHTAWVALDYWNQDADDDTKYSVLEKLAAELLDDNCTGVWFPKPSAFLHNHSGAFEYLQELASSASVNLE